MSSFLHLFRIGKRKREEGRGKREEGRGKREGEGENTITRIVEPERHLVYYLPSSSRYSF
jgi:hypothetical protein